MSPLVRQWLAERLVDWCDHAYAIWRGTLHSLGISTEWDPCELDDYYKLPAPASTLAVAAGQPGPATLGGATPAPAFHTLLGCPVCGASVGKDCVTRTRKVLTVGHKSRREAAEKVTAS